MPRFSSNRLAEWTGGRWATLPTAEIGGFGIDSRAIRRGQVFVALKTGKRDGHDFLGDALAVGASAAIVESPRADVAIPQLCVDDSLKALQSIGREHRRVSGAHVVGVTGSAGKTSTKNLLSLLLGGPGEVIATEGNLNNFLGVPLTLARIEPDATRFAVVEAGISERDEMRGLAEMIRPDSGVVTLVGPAHLEKIGSLEAIAMEKSELLRHVPSSGVVAFPHQAWTHAPFQNLAAHAIVATPAGIASPATAGRTRFVPFSLEHTSRHTDVVLGSSAATRRFRLRRVSGGMGQNAALAILIASELGIADKAIESRLEDWNPSSMRGETRMIGGRLVYLDCYNANPASMRDSIDAFMGLVPAGEPRLLVLGCMEELGPETVRYHRELGRWIKLAPADHVIAIGSQANSIADGLRDSHVGASQIRVVAAAAEARDAVAEFKGAIFVKGSRRYALESLFPGEAEPAGAH